MRLIGEKNERDRKGQHICMR